MKTLNKILSVALAGLTMIGCNDLDTAPQGYYVTTDQKTDAAATNPDLVVAAVTGIAALNTSYSSASKNDAVHIDFGYAAVFLQTDNRGTDMLAPNNSYNWFSPNNEFSDCTTNSWLSVFGWRYSYNQILSANNVIATVDSVTEDPTLQFFRAQGLAFRAWNYFQLAQLFQFTYVGHETMPCVPIITEKNANEAAANGCPRSSVQEVYNQIMSDLNEAITLLEKTTVTPEKVIDSKPKRFVSLAVAYGIRARVNLVMNKWADAANDAQSAIAKFSGSPYSLTEVSQPTIASIDDQSWMWGIAMSETDRPVTTGICNYPSFIGSFNSNGYCSVCFRKVGKNLYNAIPETDVRKGWFLNADAKSANLAPAWQEYCEEMGMPPYTQVKFAPYKNVLGTTTNANDIPLMRVEEMYYIQAEATAMAGNPTGAASMLNTFVNLYRDPAYICGGTSAESIQNAVWMQRRMEFWGEGISYFDLLRLKKGIDRRGDGWPTEWVYVIPAESDLWRIPIPQTEIEANQALTAADNNETASKPNPVEDY